MTTEIHDPSDETSTKEAAEQSSARGPGRPSKLTPELEAAIFECLQLGLTIAETCDVCGVSETQFRSWRQHYPDFAAMVRRGQAEAVKTHLAIIREAAGKRWQASAWWLERRCPQRWGRTERQTLHERKIYERDEADKIEEDPFAGSDFGTFLKMKDLIKSAVKSEVAPETSESEPGFSSPAGVPESAAGFKEDCEDQRVGAGKELIPSPAAEEREIAEARDLPPTPPLPCEEGPLQTEPCAVKTPTVFIGGARNGEAAEYTEAAESTHEQDGYRLMEVVFEQKGRDRCLKVLGDPVMRIAHVGSEAGRLFLAGNRAVFDALTAQERAFRTNGWRS